MSRYSEPAFPDHHLPPKHTGMTLRDYFAGQALVYLSGVDTAAALLKERAK